MLAIRLQRGGRKGHAQYRMIVQDARRTPTSGKVVALLGQYNPHTKTVTVDIEKADFYLKHGAQPSDRVARLLKKEGVKLPEWVKLTPNKSRSIRNPDKLRVNRPEGDAGPITDEPAPEAEAVDTPSESETAPNPASEEAPATEE